MSTNQQYTELTDVVNNFAVEESHRGEILTNFPDECVNRIIHQYTPANTPANWQGIYDQLYKQLHCEQLSFFSGAAGPAYNLRIHVRADSYQDVRTSAMAANPRVHAFIYTTSPPRNRTASMVLRYNSRVHVYVLDT